MAKQRLLKNKRIWAIYSAKGGCGKSTTSEGIASYIAGGDFTDDRSVLYGLDNQEVLVIDCDSIGSRGISGLCKTTGDKEFGDQMLSEVVFNNRMSRVKYEITQDDDDQPLYVAKSTHNPTKNTKSVWDCILHGHAFDFIPASYESFMVDFNMIDLEDLFKAKTEIIVDENDEFKIDFKDLVNFIDENLRVSEKSVAKLREKLELLLTGDDRHKGYDIIILDLCPMVTFDSLLFLGAADCCFSPIGLSNASQEAIITIMRAISRARNSFGSKVEYSGAFFTMIGKTEREKKIVKGVKEYLMPGLKDFPNFGCLETEIPLATMDVLAQESSGVSRHFNLFRFRHKVRGTDGKLDKAFGDLAKEILIKLMKEEKEEAK